MFRATAFLALVAAATAASWPMVTVNSAGDIVLNSVTRAQSFQLTAKTVTALPATGTAALTNVAALDEDIDTFKASVGTIASSGGYKLPTPTVGRTITIFNDGTGAGAFTVWTSATTVFFNSGALTTYSVPATATSVTFTATDTTNWSVSVNGAASSKTMVNVDTTSTNTAAATLTAAQVMNGYYQFAGTSTAAITTPTGAAIEAALANPNVDDAFEFTLAASSTAGATLTAAASGITITSSEAYVMAGSKKTFLVYRTAANTYTFLLKSFVPALSGTGLGNYVTVSGTSTTLDENQHNQYVVAAGTVTVTLPTCSSSNLGITYNFIQSAAATLTVSTSSTNAITAYFHVGGTTAPTSTTNTASMTVISDAALGTADGGAFNTVVCATSGNWFVPYSIGGTTGAVA